METKNNKVNGDLETKVYEQRPVDFSHTIEVAATCINVGRKLLFLELAHGKHEPGAWGVPAGKIEANETPLQAAKRELYEETGIEIATGQFQSFGQLYIRKPAIDYVYHLFEVNLDKTPQVRLSNEHLTYKWVSKQEAESLPLMKGAKQALDFYYRCHSKKQR